ncbi:ABC transporter permease [Symbiobacterium thermophilum]|uniref:ABC transporter permease protein n=2 Tax=Symbiobacterium thermophilum TaxID=2734 RepID=Q67R33_SYMTH|nr:ABC transporter permease [Symbiobacterium thermophilum]OTA41988.1 MAG: sulfate ABC transporter permease [Symbiobacterium thermophilum]BAD39860.1 ABC transporter permease protein [Symbiobacterium thermophilum IAM 14863]
MARWKAGLISAGLLLVAWQALCWTGLWPRYVFPWPEDVALTLWRLLTSLELAVALTHTLKRIGLGFALSAVGGLLLGLAMARSRTLSDLLGPVVQGLQSMPSICWYPLAVLWFGWNEGALLFVTTAGALFAVAAATESGVRNIPPSYVRAATTMGARGWRLYTRVVLPAALPSLLTGLRLGWSFAWRSLMAGELLFLNLGFGHLLAMGRDLGDASQVMAVIVVILAVGMVVDRACFSRAEAAVRVRFGYDKAA